mmetsp:Transcript_9339/g.22549  ORF Transcript_9339/g.22549 Transcript_9339/m.22549 type:complete len:365 (-) Transcript_9339:83-1177(-)
MPRSAPPRVSYSASASAKRPRTKAVARLNRSAARPEIAPRPTYKGNSMRRNRIGQPPDGREWPTPRISCATRAEMIAESTIPEMLVRDFTSSSAESRLASIVGQSPSASIAPCVRSTAARTACATTSRAKNTPASGVLNPAATPAAAPAASSCLCRLWKCAAPHHPPRPAAAPTRRETPQPSSTDGPSGPSEFPLPSVTAAAAPRVAKQVPEGGMASSTSETWQASPGPRYRRGLSSRIAATARPPTAGRNKAWQPCRRSVPVQPLVMSVPYSIFAMVTMESLKSETVTPVRAPTAMEAAMKRAREESEDWSDSLSRVAGVSGIISEASSSSAACCRSTACEAVRGSMEPRMPRARGERGATGA